MNSKSKIINFLELEQRKINRESEDVSYGYVEVTQIYLNKEWIDLNLVKVDWNLLIEVVRTINRKSISLTEEKAAIDRYEKLNELFWLGNLEEFTSTLLQVITDIESIEVKDDVWDEELFNAAVRRFGERAVMSSMKNSIRTKLQETSNEKYQELYQHEKEKSNQ